MTLAFDNGLSRVIPLEYTEQQIVITKRDLEYISISSTGNNTVHHNLLEDVTLRLNQQHPTHDHCIIAATIET